MKKIFLLLLLASHAFLAAQSNNGIIFGTNTTFMSDTEVNTFNNKYGWQIGYQFIIPTKSHFSFGIAAIYQKKKIYINELAYGSNQLEGNAHGHNAALPLSVIYQINKFNISTGYQFEYFASTNMMPANKFTHDLHLGLSYNLKFFDVKLTYTCALNPYYTRKGGYTDNGVTTLSYEYPTRMCNLSLSIIVDLSFNE